MTNRLASETSPYLLQHKDNPVDWFPWGDEAAARAKDEDKPILLSVGYSACHWCHVMERESFEDEATAATMNENFICVKVDREERPDLDAVYMDAVQTMTGHGGWPMTVFLTPDGKPFYGGTYFPPTDRHGMPAFRRVLLGVSDAWDNRREEVVQQGESLLDHMASAVRIERSPEPITSEIVQDALAALARDFDATNGGFGGAPKFPQPPVLDLLQRLASGGHEEAGRVLHRTLDAMATGGIFDQLGGGFHRYSVDAQWLVPHFEKMLYDNALLVRTYARAAATTGSSLYRRAAEMTVTWMLDEMRDDSGGFWAALDADSEGEEGLFYLWQPDEVSQALGDRAEKAARAWGVTPQGNFEGRSILTNAGVLDLEELEDERRLLLEARARRVRPATDTKVISAWNCMAVAGLAEAGALLERADWVEVARDVMTFLLDAMRIDGRLMRTYARSSGDPVVKHLGVCEDYAYALEACLALFEATGEPRWLNEARSLADDAIRLFADESGAFYATGTDAPRLVARPKDLYDSPSASANSVLALELQRLTLLTGDRSYEDAALRAMEPVAAIARRAPTGFGHLLSAVAFYANVPKEVVVIEPQVPGESRSELRQVALTTYLPYRVLLLGTDELDEALSPLLEGKQARVVGTAYVCTRGVCKNPTDDPEELRAQLVA